MSKLIKSLKPIIVSALIVSFASVAFSAAKKEAKDAADVKEKPEYNWRFAIKSIINPHEQINDEGEVVWGTCKICHRTIPDIKRDKSINDVTLKHEDNLAYLCRRCHDVPLHPAKQGVSIAVTGGNQPKSHFVVPLNRHKTNIRLALKDTWTIMPLDPKTGKIFCATCHNPHERGLLVGRADFGADAVIRLRSGNTDICRYCHRK